MPIAASVPPRRFFWPMIAVTIAYTALLVFATHYPKPEEFLGPNAPPDKALHFIAYGILGLLVAATLAASRHWSCRNVVIMGVCLALGGVFDEATQPFFGRAAEALDWVFDITGIATGIALVVIACRLLRPRAEQPPQ